MFKMMRGTSSSTTSRKSAAVADRATAKKETLADQLRLCWRRETAGMSIIGSESDCNAVVVLLGGASDRTSSSTTGLFFQTQHWMTVEHVKRLEKSSNALAATTAEPEITGGRGPAGGASSSAASSSRAGQNSVFSKFQERSKQILAGAGGVDPKNVLQVVLILLPRPPHWVLVRPGSKNSSNHYSSSSSTAALARDFVWEFLMPNGVVELEAEAGVQQADGPSSDAWVREAQAQASDWAWVREALSRTFTGRPPARALMNSIRTQSTEQAAASAAGGTGGAIASNGAQTSSTAIGAAESAQHTSTQPPITGQPVPFRFDSTDLVALRADFAKFVSPPLDVGADKNNVSSGARTTPPGAHADPSPDVLRVEVALPTTKKKSGTTTSGVVADDNQHQQGDERTTSTSNTIPADAAPLKVKSSLLAFRTNNAPLSLQQFGAEFLDPFPTAAMVCTWVSRPGILNGSTKKILLVLLFAPELDPHGGAVLAFAKESVLPFLRQAVDEVVAEREQSGGGFEMNDMQNEIQIVQYELKNSQELTEDTLQHLMRVRT
ncbi:unnamed protein product [Amoebophrya sp. A120]|nr:unnamed protein product [Amoebophrya sp. A120]|eukprot:GSA120T00024793001.1